MPSATPPLGGVDPASALRSPRGRHRPSPPHPSRRRPPASDLHRLRGRLPDPPTSAPRYRLTRPASGPAWAGARLRMPFPLPAQSAARATGEWGREGGGDVGRVGRGRAERAGRGPASSRETPGALQDRPFRNPGGGGGVPPRRFPDTGPEPSPESSYSNKPEIGLLGGMSRPPLSPPLCGARDPPSRGRRGEGSRAEGTLPRVGAQ